MARPISPRLREDAAMTPYGWLALRETARANGLHDPSMTLAVAGDAIAFAMADDDGRVDLATHPVTALLAHALRTLATDFGRRDGRRRMAVAFRLGRRPGMIVVADRDERPDVPDRPATDGRQRSGTTPAPILPQALGGPGDGMPVLVATRRTAKGGGLADQIRYDIHEVMPTADGGPSARIRVGGARIEPYGAMAWIDRKRTDTPPASRLTPKSRHHANGPTLRDALAGLRTAIQAAGDRPPPSREPKGDQGMTDGLISIYRDAAKARPHGARWKAMHVSEPGSLVGLGVSTPGDHTTDMEWKTLRAAVAWIKERHGAAMADMSRVFLPRYERREGFRPLG